MKLQHSNANNINSILDILVPQSPLFVLLTQVLSLSAIWLNAPHFKFLFIPCIKWFNYSHQRTLPHYKQF